MSAWFAVARHRRLDPLLFSVVVKALVGWLFAWIPDVSLHPEHELKGKGVALKATETPKGGAAAVEWCSPNAARGERQGKPRPQNL